MKSIVMLTWMSLTFATASAQFVTIWKTDNPGSSGPSQISFDRFFGSPFSVNYIKLDEPGVNGFIPFTATGAIVTIDLPKPGTYQIVFNNLTDFKSNDSAQKLLQINSWGTVQWKSLVDAFIGCTNLVITATDAPDLSQCTSLSQMFAFAPLVTGANFEKWDVSHITNFSEMFDFASAFNGSIGGWNMSNATDISNMFAGAHSFNQDISGWDVSNVTDMTAVFFSTISFNQPLNNWNVSRCENFTAMFEDSKFNQPLNNWDVSSGTNFNEMFESTSFNQNINNWNVSNCADFGSMFLNDADFNQPLNNWDVSKGENFGDMFSGATSFNQPLNNWNVSSGGNLVGMFGGATSFNQPLNNWNVGNAVDMTDMFSGAASFNQNIDNWNVSSCGIFFGLFNGATSFNQPLNNWNVSNGTDFRDMFNGAAAFNQPLNNWDMTNCLFTSEMFKDASTFNQDISNWNMKETFFTDAMFENATSFNQNLAAWDVSRVEDMTDMFSNSGLSNKNYDNILIGWAALPDLQDQVTLGASTNAYCLGAAARQSLIDDHQWLLVDIGELCAPTITSFTPSETIAGGTVTITGTNFANATSITFGGTPAQSFTVVSSTAVTAIVGNGDSGDVSVTTPGGAATLAGFKIDRPPVITSFTPTSAQAGTTVQITGVNFTSATAVSFGGSAAASFNVENDGLIIATVANGSSGDVSVTTPVGTVTQPGFIFTIPATAPAPSPLITFKNGDVSGSPIEAASTVDIGSIIDGDPAIVSYVTIQNSGDAPAHIKQISVSNTDFTVVNQQTDVLEQSFTTLTVDLKATSVGIHTATVMVDFTDRSFEFNISAEIKGNDIFVYNAVTPNGDNVHDFLKIVNIEHHPGNHVVILDRLGNEVFNITDYANNDPSKRFEGTGNKGGSKNLIDGTYFYVIDITTKKHTGFLLLQR